MNRVGYMVVGGVFMLVFLAACEEMKGRSARAPSASSQKTVGVSSPAAAGGGGFKWNLEVIYPDNERKDFVVMNEETPVQMRDPNWSCSYRKKKVDTDPEAKAEGLTILCANGPDVVSTFAVCATRGNRPDRNSTTLSIGNARVRMHHSITASCETF